MATHSSILAWRIPMDRGAWRATVHGVAKSQTRLSTHTINQPIPNLASYLLLLLLSRFSRVRLTEHSLHTNLWLNKQTGLRLYRY